MASRGDPVTIFRGPSYVVYEAGKRLKGHEEPLETRRDRSYVTTARFDPRDPDSLFDALHALAIENLFRSMDRLAIKINLGGGIWGVPSSQTDPALLAALLDYLLLLDFDLMPLVVEANSIGHDLDDRLLERRGFLDLLESRNVEFVNLSEAQWVEFRFRDVNKPVFLPLLLLDPAVKIISLAPMKHHWEHGVSLAQKNMYGAVTDPAKLAFHRDMSLLDRVIAGAARVMRPTLCLTGGQYACAGMGPHFCTRVPIHRVIISNDMVAADRLGAELLGYPPERIVNLQLNTREGDPECQLMECSEPFPAAATEQLRQHAFSPVQVEIHRRVMPILATTPRWVWSTLRHFEFLLPIANDYLSLVRGECCGERRRLVPADAIEVEQPEY